MPYFPRSSVLTGLTFAALAAAACTTTPDFTGDRDLLEPGLTGGDGYDTEPEATMGTALTGVVRDAWGGPIEGVLVTTSSGLSTATDRSGRFAFGDLEAGTELVNFHKDGYAVTQQPVQVLADYENAILQTLAEVDFVETFDAADGLAFEMDNGPVVNLPGANFIDETGAAYEGTVRVEATWFDLESPMEAGNEVLATPGDFTAVDADGDDAILESFGMLQVNLTGADGQELNLGGAMAAMTVPVIDLGDVDAVPGDTIPAWHYDTDLGKWVEQGMGTVTEQADGSLVWSFEAPHFSTWNVDKPLPTHGCVSGRLLDPWGAPRAGAIVRFVGQTYVSTTTARTGQDGQFCVEVKNGETGYVEFSYSYNGQPATQRTDPVTVPAGQGTCADGDYSDCISVGDVPMEIMTCVSGIVVDKQNVAVEGATVISPQGSQTITGADGTFCLTVPVFQQTTVYAVSPQDSNIEFAWKPVEVWSSPGTPACQSGCPNLAIIKPYVDTSCAEGFVTMGQGGGNMVAGLPVQVFVPEFPDVAVSYALTNSDGSYCVEVPATGDEVTVQVGQGQAMCGAETFLPTMLSMTCDWAGQGECHQVPTINCPVD